MPVPPKATERVLVADTTPAVAWRGPVSAPTVSAGVTTLPPKVATFPLLTVSALTVEVANVVGLAVASANSPP